MRVAVVDSGMNPAHRHLRSGLCRAGRAFQGADSRDEIGHGTAVAGVILFWAAEAELVPVRVFEHELTCPGELAREAVRWALEDGARVINLSLASPNPEGWAELAAEAVRRGCLLVAAAANQGSEAGYPAALETVIGVRDSGEERLFRRLDGVVDFEAPGQALPLPGGRNFSGNSLAAAHLAGLAARAKQLQPELDAEGFRELLKL